MPKEAKARILINDLLRRSGWRFFDDETGPANIALEAHVKLKKKTLEDLGDDFEKTANGYVDYLLLDGRGFPIAVLEAKSEKFDPLVGKEAEADGGEPEAGGAFREEDSVEAGGDLGGGDQRGRTRDLKAVPNVDTIVPIMSTVGPVHTIGTALFGKTQRALLRLFFVRPEQSFYLRQIVRTAAIGQGAAQRELARWVEAGLLVRTRRGNQVYYRANAASPVFAELKGLAVKTAGMADVLREALAGLAERIKVAFVHGSLARGGEKAGSDVDVVVVGAVTFSEIAAALRSAQEQLGREVNPTVYTVREFRKKLDAGHHFLTATVSAPKLFLIGGERELGQLGA